MMIGSIISRIVIIVFGTLYPAYASYKAVKTKNVKEYVKWMMYWIVFALFSSTEAFTDIFFSWLPFYYEIKIVLLIWLLSPATKGSSILYRKFVHPMLSSREQEIDDYINKAKQRSYRQVLDLGQKGVTALMQTALKGGGGLVNQLRKSYSLSDLSDPTNEGRDEIDDVLLSDPRLARRRKPGRSPHRSSSASSATIYFAENDHMSAKHSSDKDKILEVKSAEDISSGYSSGDGIYSSHQPQLQARDSIQDHRSNSLSRSRSTRVTRSNLPRKVASTDDSDENEVFDTNIIFDNNKTIQNIDDIRLKHDSSSSETEFFDLVDSNNSNNEVLMHGGNVFHDIYRNRVIVNKVATDFAGTTTLDLADNKITACKTNSYELNFNLTNLSQALSRFYPFITSSSSVQSVDGDSSLIPIENVSNNLTNTKGPNTDKEDKNISDLSNIETINIEVNQKSTNNIEKSIHDSDETLLGKNSTKETNANNVRGGKYNKKQAPVPPTEQPSNFVKPNSIKATLILQPGIVKNISRSAENVNKEIFLNYSPKLKRRSRNQSPAPSSNSSESTITSNNKMDSALNKVFRFSKKMMHLNIPGKIKQKRNSWHDFLHRRKLHNAENSINGEMIRSKSTNSLRRSTSGSLVEIGKCGSQISINSFTNHSPLTTRRLKIIRKYVDNDID